ncbi:hypothetical protein [Pseudoramibacter alactolyticus]|jgi:hypothetical protein|uniref:hypothetical protein n=1 Tax=Pseudoramibacter alactolyticus TaxID=113287 RepID=UPI0028E71D15|nr:hypothetical protein [Pseudoramibacter alactolyticus]
MRMKISKVKIIEIVKNHHKIVIFMLSSRSVMVNEAQTFNGPYDFEQLFIY